MKKIVCFIVTVSLLLSSVSVAYARTGGPGRQNYQHNRNYEINFGHCKDKAREEERTFWVKDLKIDNLGRYKIPVNIIKDGMKAAVSLDKARGMMTVTGNNKVIIFDFFKKSITVNGVNDIAPNVFKLRNYKYMKALLEYLGKQLGYKITYSVNKITVKNLNPKKDDHNLPDITKGNIIVTPVGSSVVANTFNATTQYFTATAAITAGRAIGGYAVLCVGNTAVAIDNTIAPADTTVNFTTSDGTPTNAELQSIVPKGGNVSVKLYNSNNILVNTITSDNTIAVDYAAPTITSAVIAVYNVSNGTITISVTGAGAINDFVDVKKISLHDTALNKTYQLTDSTGYVSSNTAITIKLSAADKLALTSWGTSAVSMNIAPGSLITDKAGNASTAFKEVQTITMTVNNNVSDTTKSTITISPVGSSIIANTLNVTTQYFTATAPITAGLATGGHAVLYVGDSIVAVDNTITATDTSVDFTTSDGTPSNAKLQAIVPKGGIVSVKLYNSGNLLINTITSDKTLIVDYVAPTITSTVSAVYSVSNSTITLAVTGAGAIGDRVNVKKISVYDNALNKTYQLTDSTGVVNSNTVITIKLSAADKLALASFGTSNVYIIIATGSLITDTSGNSAAAFTTAQLIPVNVAQ